MWLLTVALHAAKLFCLQGSPVLGNKLSKYICEKGC